MLSLEYTQILSILPLDTYLFDHAMIRFPIFGVFLLFFFLFFFIFVLWDSYPTGTQFHTPSLFFPPICRPIFLAKIINAMTQDNVHDMFFWAMGLSISTFM